MLLYTIIAGMQQSRVEKQTRAIIDPGLFSRMARYSFWVRWTTSVLPSARPVKVMRTVVGEPSPNGAAAGTVPGLPGAPREPHVNGRRRQRKGAPRKRAAPSALSHAPARTLVPQGSPM